MEVARHPRRFFGSVAQGISSEQISSADKPFHEHVLVKKSSAKGHFVAKLQKYNYGLISLGEEIQFEMFLVLF